MTTHTSTQAENLKQTVNARAAHDGHGYKPKHTVRIVTATSLFDGHDAAINVMRRMMQDAGCEVIHLGHNRSVAEIVNAAIQEDANGVAVTSYQGGHNEFFGYMVDLLRERKAGHIRVFGGGGGTILPREIEALQRYGVSRLYSPEDGRLMGLTGMIDDLVQRADMDVAVAGGATLGAARDALAGEAALDDALVARLITWAEQGTLPADVAAALEKRAQRAGKQAPVLGITGTGGSGKSSLTDELIRRFTSDFSSMRVAILAVDPSRKRTGGALLGDRIRMNVAANPNVYLRSLATRDSGSELSLAVEHGIAVARGAGFDLIVVETSGIGQASSAITDVADVTLYVMTPEFGAATQLEKIDMLDVADAVAVNKCDRRGGDDAIRDVRKQVRRARKQFEAADEAIPVFGTVASRFGDTGVTALYLHLLGKLGEKAAQPFVSKRTWPVDAQGRRQMVSAARTPLIPAHRENYLAEIARVVRDYKAWVAREAMVAREAWHLAEAARLVGDEGAAAMLREKAAACEARLDARAKKLIEGWPQLRERYSADEFAYTVRGETHRQPLVSYTLSGTRIPRVALPTTDDPQAVLNFLALENVPGEFPFVAGVFPLKRPDEEPTRLFAGEGGPARTNERFHLLCAGEKAHRLSTAFDSVTLYGENPDRRPDIFGKIGESGVSVATLDDAKLLYSGFDLCAPTTSVSKTINGPAPIVLAFFLNAAIDQQVEQFVAAHGREPTGDEWQAIRAKTLKSVRGTVQADILKEDQAQNTCIFSTGFALKMMGDIQQFFIENEVRNYYSVSVSGYHIAEAGANPISQVAFTLANGFTFVEAYLARGMKIDDFAPNLSFFFSNGLDIEYAVIGRVARRIWAVAMRDRYHANDRSQRLKYHIQTSGRSLHAQEIDFNDIRTTLQALMAIYDNCNSLHTNAYDEAVTTPTAESVRRAKAIQLIINREYGLMRNENGLQGSYIMRELTELVEEAILSEFERLNERGGVLGAMETMYQRGRIQDESMLYERKKHSGELPIIGVNTFVNADARVNEQLDKLDLSRSSDDEKQAQIDRLHAFQARNAGTAAGALSRLKAVADAGGNIFAELMETVRHASLGEISQALYEVGGQYRRNM